MCDGKSAARGNICEKFSIGNPGRAGSVRCGKIRGLAVCETNKHNTAPRSPRIRVPYIYLSMGKPKLFSGELASHRHRVPLRGISSQLIHGHTDGSLREAGQ